jgi:hypothetical protein
MVYYLQEILFDELNMDELIIDEHTYYLDELKL